eukprot:tig00020824_g14233.t1
MSALWDASGISPAAAGTFSRIAAAVCAFLLLATLLLRSSRRSRRAAACDSHCVFVTGCSSGIGQAIAVSLDAAGCKVIAGVRRAEDGQRLQDACRSLKYVIVDVANLDLVRRLPEAIAGMVGDSRLSLVNNAGVMMQGPLESTAIEEMKRLFDVNVFGVCAVSQALLPTIRRTRGRLVIIGSICGFGALPFWGAYSASKFAVEGIADSLRRELRPLGVPVSLIQAGAVRTPMIGEKVAGGEWAALAERAPAYAAGLEGFRRFFLGLQGGACEPAQASPYPPTAPPLGSLGLASRQEASTASRPCAGAPAPAQVADAVAEALLCAGQPRARYLVGRDAGRLRALHAWLGDAALDRVYELALR